MSRVQVKVHEYNIDNKPSVNVKQFGDLHVDENFDFSKLDKIEESLDSSDTDYVMFTGDMIDYTNFLYSNIDVMKKLLKWIRKIASKYKMIIGFGNHDTFKKTNEGWKEDYCINFINELSNIDGVNLLGFDPCYEDDKISVVSPFIPFNYYENESRKEDKSVLIDTLKEFKNVIESMPADKLKFLILHSPVFVDCEEALGFIKYFDFVLSGHMHNGVVPPILDNIVKNNRGIISPDKSLFPSNARGVKTVDSDLGNTNIIITGGVTKLSNASKLGVFNNIFPMSVEDIRINKKVLK